MKWKALALLAGLVIGTVLAACGPDSPGSPDIPKKALSALHRYARPHSNGPYEIVSAERVLHVEGIEEALHSKGIEARIRARELGLIDEAWCVHVHPLEGLFIEHYCGPHATDCPQGPKLYYGQVLLVRRGDIWEARAVWEYVDQVKQLDGPEVDQALSILLDALGCDNLKME